MATLRKRNDKWHATTWIITCEEYNNQKSRDFKNWKKTDRKK